MTKKSSRKTADSLVRDLRQRQFVVVGTLDDFKEDLDVEGTHEEVEALKEYVRDGFAKLQKELDDKFGQLEPVPADLPNTCYEIRDRQGILVDDMNKLVNN